MFCSYAPLMFHRMDRMTTRWAYRTHTAFAASLGSWKSLSRVCRTEKEHERAQASKAQPFLLTVPSRRCPTGWGTKDQLPKLGNAWERMNTGHARWKGPSPQRCSRQMPLAPLSHVSQALFTGASTDACSKSH